MATSACKYGMRYLVTKILTTILYIGIPSCSSTIVITHMICFRFSVVTQIIENPVLVIQERKKNTYKPNL